jgi:hypothetical protein
MNDSPVSLVSRHVDERKRDDCRLTVASSRLNVSIPKYRSFEGRPNRSTVSELSAINKHQ